MEPATSPLLPAQWTHEAAHEGGTRLRCPGRSRTNLALYYNILPPVTSASAMMLACQVLSDWLALAVVDNLGHQLTLSDQFGLIDQSFVGLTPAFVSMLTAFCNGKGEDAHR